MLSIWNMEWVYLCYIMILIFILNLRLGAREEVAWCFTCTLQAQWREKNIRSRTTNGENLSQGGSAKYYENTSSGDQQIKVLRRNTNKQNTDLRAQIINWQQGYGTMDGAYVIDNLTAALSELTDALTRIGDNLEFDIIKTQLRNIRTAAAWSYSMHSSCLHLPPSPFSFTLHFLFTAKRTVSLPNIHAALFTLQLEEPERLINQKFDPHSFT